MMSLDQPREATAFARPNHVHNVFWLEFFGQHTIALLQIVRSASEMKFSQKLHALSPRFRQVLRDWLVLLLGIFDEPKLNGVIAVCCRRFSLCNDAGSSLDESDRNNLPLLGKHLRHANLLPKNPWTHALPCLYFLPKALISTSTPAG